MAEYSISTLEKFSARIGGHLRHYGANVEIESFRDSSKNALYGGSYVRISLTRRDGIHKSAKLCANGYWHSAIGDTKVFSGRYSLKDAKYHICNMANMSIPTRYLGQPIDIDKDL